MFFLSLKNKRRRKLKKQGVWLVLVKYSWVWGLPRSVVGISIIPRKSAALPLTQQLLISKWFLDRRGDFAPTSPLPTEVFGLALTSACYPCLWLRKCISPDKSRKYCFLKVIYHSWLLQSSRPTSLSLECDKDIHSELSTPKPLSHSAHGPAAVSWPYCTK